MNFRHQAKAIAAQMGPKKSLPEYEKAYIKFKAWLAGFPEEFETIDEDMLLVYFQHRLDVEHAAPSTLWPLYSKLKTILQRDHDVDISKFSVLRKFCKDAEKGHIPKRAHVFTDENLIKFISDAPDQVFLLHKVRSF